MASSETNLPVGQAVSLPGHFDTSVVLEDARRLGVEFECRVRLLDGTLDEVVISADEAASLAAKTGRPQAFRLVDPNDLQLLVESARIRLAYAHDRQFAVSLSSIRILGTGSDVGKWTSLTSSIVGATPDLDHNLNGLFGNFCY